MLQKLTAFDFKPYLWIYCVGMGQADLDQMEEIVSARQAYEVWKRGLGPYGPRHPAPVTTRIVVDGVTLWEKGQ